MRPLPLPRWTVSFADLALLLLAVFVLLHARGAREVTLGGRMAFSSDAAVMPLMRTRARDLFEPGEARLTPKARADLLMLARSLPADQSLRVESEGRDRPKARFDGWELSAARAAAVAHVLSEAGLAEERVSIGVADSRPSEAPAGQMLTVRVFP